MNENFTSTKAIKLTQLIVFLFCFSTADALTYYLRNEGGNWNDSITWSTVASNSATNTGTFPIAGDNVYFNGTGTVNLSITANAACANFYNESENEAILNLLFSSNTTLTVSALFQITTAQGKSRTTNVMFDSGATTANLNIGTHLYSGTLNTTSYIACANVIALSGPDVTVSGNVNIFNNTNGTLHMRSSISHTAGKLKLTGTTVRSSNTPTLGPTSGSGYLNTYQNNGNLSTDNKYQMSGTASLEFYHVGETPVHIQRTAENPPIFNGSPTTSVSYIENSVRSTAASVIYGSNYSILTLNNDNGASKANLISGTSCGVSNELNIINGSLNLTSTTLTLQNNAKINISSSGTSAAANLNKCITATNANLLNYAGYVDLTYSGNAIKPGLELKTANSTNTNGVNNLILNNTNNFNFGSGNVFYTNGSTTPTNILKVLQSTSITDNNFTADFTELNCPTISLNGTTLVLNSKLNASTNISINGSTTSNNTITAPDIIIDGDGSSYNSTITASNNLTISGSTTFNGEIITPEILVNTGAPCTFYNSLTNISFLTINSDCIITNPQYITNTLSLGANLTNESEISTEHLTITSNVVLDPGVSATGKLKVLDLLTISPSTYLTTGGELILVSNAANTARVAPIHDNAVIGDVTVERYLPNLGRKWRLLTAPLKGNANNTLFNNWQNNGSEELKYFYGTDIWGPSNTYEYFTNGLDYINLSTHNFRKFTNGTWSSVTNSMTEELFNSTKNNTFLTFIIAPAFVGVDKTNAPNCEATSNSSPTTLLAKGELLIGEQSYDLTSTYNLIGNPYASPIDFYEIINPSGINSTAVDPKIWILDPRIGSFGNYITWDPYAGYSDLRATNYVNENNLIQSGQGFFVKRKTGNTSTPLIINETHKSNGNFNNSFGRFNSNRDATNVERLRVTISKIEDNTDVHKDACVVAFYNGASNGVTGNDVQKFSNLGETLSIMNGNTSLSSEHRLPVVDGDVLFIRLINGTTSSYILKINTENFTFSGSATLHDLKLGTITPIPLDGTLFEYNFDVTSDNTTQGTRFKIVFSTTLGIEENNPLNVKVYPNPTTNSNGVILNTGNLEFGNYEYKIVNVLGQIIQNGTIQNIEINQETKIEFNNTLKTGWYNIQVIDRNSKNYSFPIIIK